MNPTRVLLPFAVSLLAASAAAQKLPLAGANGREAALVDVRALLPRPAAGKEPDIEAMRTALAELAGFVREFCEPELAATHDVQPVAERWLAVVGTSQQLAFVERLVATAEKEPETQVVVEGRFYELPAAAFAQHVEPLLPAIDKAQVPALSGVPVVGFLFERGDRDERGARVAVIDAQKAAALHAALETAAGVTFGAAPKAVLRSLQAATIATGEEISYRKDYECRVENGEFVWHEVRDTVFDGIRLGATCGLLDDERIALRFELLLQHVQHPFPEFATTLTAKAPGKSQIEKKVTVELPHVTGVKTKQSLVLKDGASALVVGQKDDGTWCVSTVGVRRRN